MTIGDALFDAEQDINHHLETDTLDEGAVQEIRRVLTEMQVLRRRLDKAGTDAEVAGDWIQTETARPAVRRAWLHAANIGRIVLALAEHDAGDWGDCSINDPVVSIIDRGEPAHVLLQALADMREETAASICQTL
jgi:hypothetical protein